MSWFGGSKQSEIKRLIAQLGDPSRREQAARDLLRLGVEAAPLLVQSLSLKDAAAGAPVREILVRMGAAAIPALAQALREAHPLVRAQAALILGKTRQPAAPPLLLDALESEFYTVRAGAALGLGELGERSAEPVLLKALKDSEPDVRAAAAISLGKLGAVSAYDEIANLLLDDSKTEVRQAAARALGGTGDPAALPYLMEALHDSFWWYEREAAGDLLEAIRGMGKAAIPVLIESLSDAEGTVRRIAATLLGELRASEAVEELGMALYDLHHEVGTAAARALNQIGPDSLGVLAEAARHPEPGIRENVALALEGIPAAGTAIVLGQLVRDTDRNVRKQAVLSLAACQDARARKILEEIAGDRNDRELQASARLALDKLRANSSSSTNSHELR